MWVFCVDKTSFDHTLGLFIEQLRKLRLWLDRYYGKKKKKLSYENNSQGENT